MINQVFLNENASLLRFENKQPKWNEKIQVRMSLQGLCFKLQRESDDAISKKPVVSKQVNR